MVYVKLDSNVKRRAFINPQLQLKMQLSTNVTRLEFKENWAELTKKLATHFSAEEEDEETNDMLG